MDELLVPYCEAIREAVSAGTALRIRGGGTKDFLGRHPDGAVLDMRPLAGIVDYEPTELVVTARGGTSLAAVERELTAQGQFFAFEPPRFGGDPTIGGMVAAGLSGPRRASSGALRDYVLGATVVDGTSRVLRFGGSVMKNVAGFDVSRLMAGSCGILGVIVDVSLRVMPRPEVEHTLTFDLGAAEAIAAFNRWSRLPFPLSGTTWFDGRASVRLSGAEAAVRTACRTLGGTALGCDEARAHWTSVRDHTHVFLAPRVPLWRLSVPSTAPTLPLSGSLLIEWNGALRWLRSDAPAQDVHAAVRAVGGSASLWHAADDAGATIALDPTSLAIHRRLKQSFDPSGILNPGRLIDGL